jgi:hypothetical protein
VLASALGDPTENARRAWVAGQSEGAANDFTIARDDLGDFSFMVIGDTGEGDVSQYSTVPAFDAASGGTEFAVIASDVIYPAGDVNEYVEKFFVPYAGYPKPIYAIPGNHDWLDGLVGFMRHFCGASPPADKFRPPARAKWARLGLWAHRVVWRRPRDLDPATVEAAERLRGEAAAAGPPQPNMYFCIDTPQLRIVAIDTGILGRLDYEQRQADLVGIDAESATDPLARRQRTGARRAALADRARREQQLRCNDQRRRAPLRTTRRRSARRAIDPMRDQRRRRGVHDVHAPDPED